MYGRFIRAICEFLAGVGGDDTTAHLWDPLTGKESVVFMGHTDAVNDMAFSPDGKHILTAGGDTTARLWPTDYHDTIR
jgi:WD40 repeat protein